MPRKGVIFSPMRTVSLQEAKEHLDKLVQEAGAGAELVIAGTGVRLVPVFSREQLDEESQFRNFGLDQGTLTIPKDFDAPMAEIEELFSNSSIEPIEIRRAVVRALCKLADSLPVIDPRSTEEILSDEGEGFF